MHPSRLPFPPFRTEAELSSWVLAQLEPTFAITEQVVGRHWSGRRLRIDAVLRPRDPEPWKDVAPAFGVEFKLADERSFDTRNFTGWAAQAVAYAQTEWNDFGRLAVFACPSPLRLLCGSSWGEGAAGLMEHLLGQFGVGELTLVKPHGLILLLQGHRMWSVGEGVREATRWSLRPKTGTR
jgi:hypothetical protein